jgi:hypothetical protein
MSPRINPEFDKLCHVLQTDKARLEYWDPSKERATHILIVFSHYFFTKYNSYYRVLPISAHIRFCPALGMWWGSTNVNLNEWEGFQTVIKWSLSYRLSWSSRKRSDHCIASFQVLDALVVTRPVLEEGGLPLHLMTRYHQFICKRLQMVSSILYRTISSF